MKRINTTFEIDESRSDIDILFKASEEDDQVKSLIERVADPLAGVLTAYDARDSAVSLPEEHIITVSTDNKKLRIIANDGEYWVRQPIQDMEKRLNPSWFLRISRYQIINLRKVGRFDFSISGVLRIEMEDGSEVWASRRFIPTIKKRLQRKG